MQIWSSFFAILLPAHVVVMNVYLGHRDYSVVGAYLILILQLILIAEFYGYVRQKSRAESQRCPYHAAFMFVFLVETIVSILQVLNIQQNPDQNPLTSKTGIPRQQSSPPNFTTLTTTLVYNLNILILIFVFASFLWLFLAKKKWIVFNINHEEEIPLWCRNEDATKRIIQECEYFLVYKTRLKCLFNWFPVLIFVCLLA